MRKTIILIAVYIFIPLSILYSYHIDYNDTGFKIVFSDIDYNIQKFEFGELSVCPSILNLGSMSSNSPFESGVIQILFAIPANANVSFSSNISEEEQLPGKLKKSLLSESLKSDIKYDISFELIGKQRGIDIASLKVFPIEYSDHTHLIKLIKALTIQVDYGITLPILDQIPDYYELHLFSHLVNSQHLINIISESLKNNKELNPIQLTGRWYDSEKKYVRITTKKDGIASASLSEILKYLPELNSKSPNYLHLLKNGEEVPLFYIDDNGGIIDSEDTIVFLGSRAKGDTTWTDHYADMFSFFLYFDENQAGIRFKDFPTVSSAADTIDAVKIYKHIETEKTYHRGFPQEPSETQPGEGWFWNVISPTINWDNTFRDSLLVIPSNPNDSMNLTFQFASCKWNPDFEDITAHSLQIDINGNHPKKQDYMVRARDSLNYSISHQDIIPGLNVLNVQTLKVYNKQGEEIEVNQVGADFYTYQLNSKPFAMNGYADFFIAKHDKSSKLIVPNFSHKSIWLIDSTNKLLKTVDGEQGTFSITSANYNKSFSSVIINNSSRIISNERGLLIAFMNSRKFESRFFETAGKEAGDYLSTIPESAFLAVSFNGETIPSSSVVNFFTQFGSNQISKVKGNDQWVMFGNKKSNIHEKYSSSSYVSIDGFTVSSSGESYQANIELPVDFESGLIFNDESSIEKSLVFPVNNTDLISNSNQADVIVLMNKNFKNSAELYANFRENTHNDLNIKIIDIEDIYKEFNSGKSSPKAIKEFLIYAFGNWALPKIKYVLIWGDASWDVRKIEKGSINENYVSSFGWPASDFWYAHLDGDLLPELQIGRVPINSDQQGFDYIDKLVLNDSIENNPWMKNFFMITGGQTQEEIDRFHYYGAEVFNNDNIAKTNLCADTLLISKKEPANTTESSGGQIQKIINDGVLWTFYMGHGSARVMDMDGWQVQKLNNKGKYGFMSTLSCNTSAFAEPNLITRNEEYVIEKDKGFIGTGGSSGVSYESTAINMGLLMLQSLSKEIPAQSYLDAIWYAKSRMIYSIEERLTIEHFTYLGDPLAGLKISKLPDFYFLRNGIDISTNKNTTLITSTDTVVLSGYLYNLGNRFFKEIKVKLFHEFAGKTDTLTKIFYGLCYPGAFKFDIDVVGNPGTHRFTLWIDPDNTTGDINLQNNKQTFIREVFNQGIYPLEPLANWNVKNEYPRFRVVNPSEKGNTFQYNFRIYASSDTSLTAVEISVESDVLVSETYTDWTSKSVLERNRNYWLGLYTVKKSDNTYTPIQIIPFNTYEGEVIENAKLTIDNSTNFLLSGELDGVQAIIKNQANLVLDEKPISYFISSIYGSAQSPDRDSEIRYDDAVYITVPPDILGFKLVAISPDSMKPYAIRNYNTYDDYEQAEQFVRFIKDTANNRDYLLLSTNGESFRAFRHLKFTEPENIGSLDSLRYYLKNYYGSRLSDTLDTDIGSYSMIGRKNFNSDSTIEALNYDGDTARIEGYITKYTKSGTYVTNEFGPAKVWKNLNINAGIDNESSVKLSILAQNVNTQVDELIYSEYLSNDENTFDLSIINSTIYPKIRVELLLERIYEGPKPNVKKLQVEYVPTPEFAVSHKHSSLAKDTILRGDNMTANILVKNISLRSSASETNALVKIQSDSKPILDLLVEIPDIAIDNETMIIVNEESDNFDVKNTIFCSLNYIQGPSELYTYNNDISFTQYLIEDEIKPNIVFKADGIEVAEGDYVSRVPFLEVELHDNSAMVIDDVKKIGIGINRPFPGSYDTVFTSFGRDIPKKALLAFYSDTLDYGENYFKVIVYDAAGNSDTLIRKVFVSLNGHIDDLFVYPNPFVDEISIRFDLKAPNNDGTISVDIYNLAGQKIFDMTKPSKVGTNEFTWNGRDFSGSIQPSGIYLFIITQKSSTYVEPKTGKVIFVR